jgi:queuine/archaeosine tRNA-ribosyltransferase
VWAGIAAFKMNRLKSVAIGGRSIRLPCFFPSISSVKSNLKPVEYLTILRAVHEPHFLISAYDLSNAKTDETRIENLMQESADSGTIILLDSGNYESFWKQDSTWTQKRFGEILKKQLSPIAFCFDDQHPSNSLRSVVSQIVDGTLRDQGAFGGSIVPIIHARHSQLPDVATKVALKLRPLMLAVPERILGDGLIARAQMVFAIRQALNKTGVYIPLHLLGTGNPRSILIYAISGADSFDGLEWCQTVADPETCQLHHFQQREFVARQLKISPELELPYLEATLIHNLLFYRKWICEIQDKCEQDQLKELALTLLPDKFIGDVRERAPNLLG